VAFQLRWFASTVSGLFAFSYALLCGLTLLEGVVLREALRRVIRFRRLHAAAAAARDLGPWLPTGTAAPEFSAPELGTGRTIGTSDLRGRSTILLFVSPTEASSPSYQHLVEGIHAMWHKVEGNLYLVCSGGDEDCRRFASEHKTAGFGQDQLRGILDPGSAIARKFLITCMPRAVELDEEARVKKYGKPEPSEGVVGAHAGPARTQDESARKVLAGHRVQASEGSGSWPDNYPLSGAGFARMHTTISCVLTRFRLRSAWSLIAFYLRFLKVRRAARGIGGLVRAIFVVENPRTCYTLSLWKDDWAIVEFGSVHAHVKAARSAFGPTFRKDLNRAEIWSAQFRLWAVSCHNLNWEGLDMQALLADQWPRRAEAAQVGPAVEKTVHVE